MERPGAPPCLAATHAPPSLLTDPPLQMRSMLRQAAPPPLAVAAAFAAAAACIAWQVTARHAALPRPYFLFLLEQVISSRSP
jgi:hypothetical protein